MTLPGLAVGAAAGAAAAALALKNSPAKERFAFDASPVPAKDDIDSSIMYHAEHTATSTPANAAKPSAYQAYVAAAASVADRVLENWNATQATFDEENPKQVYYLSMEFLQGRALTNALGNLELTEEYAAALRKLGYELEDVVAAESDMALGNGGLGRLASCFLDSIASLELPGWGYGLRYKYGLFRQAVDGIDQTESPESWLDRSNVWEVPRYDVSYPVRFGGSATADGKWVGGTVFDVMAYDTPIPGYKTRNTISLRLWQAKPASDLFDLPSFNAGEHQAAMATVGEAEALCAVLYPGDDSREGKALRLKQQYMLCSASLQDIINTFKARGNARLSDLPKKATMQLNDTHPTLAIPELMRILMDEEGLNFDNAWKITSQCVNYTNHTVLPEALEKWDYALTKELLPRHVQIIEQIDAHYKKSFPKAPESTYIIEYEEAEAEEAPAAAAAKEAAAAAKAPEPVPSVVRMANMCVIAGKYVNGVAAIHSEIVKDDVFNDAYKLFPNKFQNKTNGVTLRRWLAFCNPSLTALISEKLGGDEWLSDWTQLERLREFADDKDLQAAWRESKLDNKRKLAEYVYETQGIKLNPEVEMFDIQVKRIHEYKRQLLNILGVVYRYKKMKEMSSAERAKVVPRAVMIGGKAFATYEQAKRIVKFINAAGKVINADKDVGDKLKVAFLPNYNVSLAEKIIPASELSQHISTAGMEASGTSNMKFTLNGCLIIGTLDGANVEIRECVGEENFFLFGYETEDIPRLRAERAAGKFVPDPRFVETVDYIKSGVFGETFEDMLDSLEGNEGFGRGDYFCVAADFPAYIEAQEKVDEAYLDQDNWTKMSILNTAGSGFFSSDRTIKQYADEIWDVKPIHVE